MKRSPILSLVQVSFLFLLSIVSVRTVWAQSTLENPQPGSFQSGIGVISGWACDAERIEIIFNETDTWQASYGTRRTDTQGVCGDANNGFGLLFNWNLLGEGSHTVQALADGVEIGRATVTVTTLGEEFLRGVGGEAMVSDFPTAGNDIVIRWQETQQNFVITDSSSRPLCSDPSCGTSGRPPRVLENPAPGSFQSGVGVISGWVCDASQIEIEFDNNAANRWQAGYGTRRTDTQGVCGDVDNGFGLVFNWNILGNGSHTVTAYADGVEFASVTVTVTTLGEEFRRGLSREVTIPGFPEVGTDVVLQWQEAQQNFVIIDVDGPLPDQMPISKMYWINRRAGTIQRANLDGSQIETLVSTSPGRYTLDEVEGKMYWTADGIIQRANLDGSQIETLVSGLDSPRNLTFDEVGSKMYWTADGIIQRANLDGSQIETLVSETGSFLSDFVLDVVEGKMYWTDHFAVTIQRANLDGSQIETLVDFYDLPMELGLRIALLDKLALDEVGGKMYWTDRGLGTIQRANLDGSQIEILVSGLTSIWSFALDEAGGKMYWTVDGTIQRANLDGSQTEILVSGLTRKGRPIYGPTLDMAGGKMYWTVDGTIQRANLDGSQTEILVSGLGSVWGPTLVSLPDGLGDPTSTFHPDLIVESPVIYYRTVGQYTVGQGESFTMEVMVRNQGKERAASTTLRYYRSSDSTISSSDTQVGTSAVSSLNAALWSRESISLTAPTSAGTYYYGACVDSVSGEQETGNNCSRGKQVTVQADDGGGSGAPAVCAQLSGVIPILPAIDVPLDQAIERCRAMDQQFGQSGLGGAFFCAVENTAYGETWIDCGCQSRLDLELVYGYIPEHCEEM